MSDAVVHPDDTISLAATLPRDLTDCTVEFLFTDEEIPFSAVVQTPEDGDVAVPLSIVEPDEGTYEIKWKITYNDETVEVLPPHGDTLDVVR